ncbi:MAG TPA: hypothetical protein VHW01_27255 [Polyangiaceae bacterium]|nr:hypothetical protein [Polyangiaceae bacterium]
MNNFGAAVAVTARGQQQCGAFYLSLVRSPAATAVRIGSAPPTSRTRGGKNHLNHTTQTESCPAQPDGSAYRCIGCSAPIAVGAQVLDYGRHGYSHYPSCDAASSPAAAGTELDNGDLVARAMGLIPAPTPRASAVTTSTAQTLDNGDKVAAAMGLGK